MVSSFSDGVEEGMKCSNNCGCLDVEGPICQPDIPNLKARIANHRAIHASMTDLRQSAGKLNLIKLSEWRKQEGASPTFLDVSQNADSESTL